VLREEAALDAVVWQFVECGREIFPAILVFWQGTLSEIAAGATDSQ